MTKTPTVEPFSIDADELDDTVRRIMVLNQASRGGDDE